MSSTTVPGAASCGWLPDWGALSKSLRGSSQSVAGERDYGSKWVGMMPVTMMASSKMSATQSTGEVVERTRATSSFRFLQQLRNLCRERRALLTARSSPTDGSGGPYLHDP